MFDYALGSVGVLESELSNYDYEIVEQTQKQHAGYYPCRTTYITCLF